MIKTVFKAVMYATAAWLWWWLVVFKIPVMLTAGSLSSLLGITLLTLCVVVPASLAWKFIKGKIKESPK